MRTNIVIDDELMAAALKLMGIRTKREVVETALKIMIDLKKQEQIRKYRGNLEWLGDLEEMRLGR